MNMLKKSENKFVELMESEGELTDFDLLKLAALTLFLIAVYWVQDMFKKPEK